MNHEWSNHLTQVKIYLLYLVNHAGIHLLLSEIPATSNLIHVLDVHKFEGILIGT